jgi:hypothetical protein
VGSAPSVERFGLSACQPDAIDAVRRDVAAHGELPTPKKLTEDLPTAWTIRHLFGSRNGYPETAGFTPRPTESGTAPVVSPQHRDGPNSTTAGRRAEWLRPSDRHPSKGQVRRLFGTWSAAIYTRRSRAHRGRTSRAGSQP